MNIFKRLQTTLRADANGLIDALEEPTLMLEQHLRDAELALHEEQAALHRLEQEAKRLGAERERAEADRARFDDDAELALGQGRDDLARYALGQLVPRLRLLERIEARLASIAEESRALRPKLESRESALEELRGRVRAYRANRQTGAVDVAPEPVSDEQIEIELLRRKARQAPRADVAPPPSRVETEGRS
jgi:phage shock protein A